MTKVLKNPSKVNRDFGKSTVFKHQYGFVFSDDVRDWYATRQVEINRKRFAKSILSDEVR